MSVSSKLLSSIPESYFGKTMGRKLEVGDKPLINTAVGIPDQQVDRKVLNALQDAIVNPDNHRYGVFRGKEALKKEIQKFYKDVYDVSLEDDEICILYGTKNGLVHIPACVIEPGEGVLLLIRDIPITLLVLSLPEAYIMTYHYILKIITYLTLII